MGLRRYTVPLLNASVTNAAQDLLFLNATANMAIRICQIELAAEGQTSPLELRIALKYIPATVTAGTGGSAVTPQPFIDTDSAATFTARSLDVTTRASSTGTVATKWASSFQVLNGWQVLQVPESIWSCKLSTAFVVGLENAPGSAITMNMVAVIEEAF